ncbi:bifunctional diguanylate cyclase/phosphodiesterase [Poseidonocella sedimentorum]|nr:bifunctional diguanylate cyclase/phosphodiesterase [Poseidonocella sedimentorum]
MRDTVASPGAFPTRPDLASTIGRELTAVLAAATAVTQANAASLTQGAGPEMAELARFGEAQTPGATTDRLPEQSLSLDAEFISDLTLNLFNAPRISAAGAMALRALSLPIAQALTFERRQRELTRRETALSQQRAVVEHAAQCCGLTGVLMATPFHKEAQCRLAKADRATLLHIDIDDFRTINDRLGPRTGDDYLLALADAVKSVAGTGALSGRIGDDRFALLLIDQTRGTDAIIALLREAYEDGIHPLGFPELGRLRIGVATRRDRTLSYEDFKTQADVALAAAKAMGRNQTVHHEPSLDRLYDHRAFQTSFTDALQKGEIIPFFQPILDLDTGVPYGLEVLARWKMPDGEIKSPAAFAGAFSDRSIAPMLTRRIVDGLARALEEWHVQGATIGQVCLNVTAADVGEPDQLLDITHQLAAAGLPSTSLTLEITENIVLEDRKGQMRRVLQTLRDQGVRVALDDFGTGYGSLAHLSSWPVDILKIDRQFVERLARSPRDREIVRALISLGANLGLDVVAEGIETDWQRRFLSEAGAALGQGYLFAKPLPASAYFEFIAGQTKGQHVS